MDECRTRAPAVKRALDILEMLAGSDKGLTLSEMARNLNVPRSSAFYILDTMEGLGYVQRNHGRGRYSFTFKLFELVNSNLTGADIREPAAPHLRCLVEQTGLTVHLGVLAQNEVVLIGKWSPPGRPTVPTWIGKRMPWHCTGTGKALMAYAPEAQLNAAIRRGLVRYNENTIVCATRMKQDLQRVRTLGYSLDDEEETLGLRCIGAPVFRGGSSPVAAFSLAGTTAELDQSNLDRFTGLMKAAALAVSAKLVEGFV
jgi:DNA-binding IclR family transcriptional regulator